MTQASEPAEGAQAGHAKDTQGRGRMRVDSAELIRGRWSTARHRTAKVTVAEVQACRVVAATRPGHLVIRQLTLLWRDRIILRGFTHA